MNKRATIAALVFTIVMMAPPLALGYLLFRVWHMTILHASPAIIALALIDTYLSNLAHPHIRRWVHGYQACIDLTVPAGTSVPKGTRFQGKDANDVWETVVDQTADETGKICLKLNRVPVRA